MQKRAIETRAKILRAATELFARHGMNGTSVDRIAETAGINKQRIYAYFGSKEKLFIASLTHVFKEAEPFSDAMIKKLEQEPEKLTENLLRGFKEFHRTHPHFWRLLAWANLEDARLLENLKNVRGKENNALRRLFEQACADNRISGISFENYLFTMLAVPWFLRSNGQTLQYTLGYDPRAEEFSSSLFADLNTLFSSDKE